MDFNFSLITRPVERLVATAQNGLEVLRLGGLETGSVPSPSQTVESVPMYKLRRYFPPGGRSGQAPVGPPVLMVHPMMMSADMWDVTRDDGAVGILHAKGLDPWVIDFGSPDKIEGGMRRNLADHIVALNEAIDTVKKATVQRAVECCRRKPAAKGAREAADRAIALRTDSARPRSRSGVAAMR